MVGWIKNRWMVGWMESKKIDEAIDGWMDRKDKWMVIILGDFNIHYNNVHKSIKLRQLLDSFDMNQHVAGATHKQGNILDLVITPNHDNLIKSVTVCDYNISDHYCVE